MEYRYAAFFKLLNALVDYFLLNLILVAELLWVSKHALEATIVNSLDFHLLIMSLLWFCASNHSKIYQKVLKTEAEPLLKRTIWALVIFCVAILLLHLATPNMLISLDNIIPFLLIFSLLTLSTKVIFLSLRKANRKYWFDDKKIVILGANDACRELYEHFRDSKYSGYLIQGYFSDKPCNNLSDEFKYLGKPEDSIAYACQNGISEIFSALPSRKAGLVKKLMREADNNLIRFRFVPDIGTFMDSSIMIEYYGILPIISQRREPLQVKMNEMVKKGFDFLFAALTSLFILTWLIPIIAIAIKIDSPGPIFFRQLRSGKDNKPFFCLKFRSMYVNRESDFAQATKNDNRITRVGAFLRKTSLDEFPQFLNVLRGDMSIVGPRPHMLKHTQDYSQLIDDFMVRQFVNPGITGWAQVNGLRGETKETESMNNRVKADLWYMENWSFLLDLKIVFLTLWQTLKKNENAF